jgi:hypothetical protein
MTIMIPRSLTLGLSNLTKWVELLEAYIIVNKEYQINKLYQIKFLMQEEMLISYT